MKRIAIILVVVIVGLSLFLFMNNQNQLPQQFLQISHRGASAYELEHSLAAYELALAQGTDYLEVDVQLTKDGQLVVVHDDVPTFGDGRRVEHYLFSELQQAHRADYGVPLLTVEDAFQTFPFAKFYIETKSNSKDLNEKLLRLIEQYHLEDSTIIQSFHKGSLKWFRKNNDSIPLIQLLSKIETARLSRLDLFFIKRYADGVGVNDAVFKLEDVEKIHRTQLKVHVYTVDDAERMRELIEAEVDGIFTNRPDVLHRLIEGTVY
ncbi:glycerophosphodiester phosphodiesterase [Solibacillus sp. FSL H8-0538]|uniref:glycerophosphodiester phosphodiesterase n=1 Tax=Solibacillus sp. FSL H8-0538 TaxID=2921400 RepID=UPI0030F9B380